jgi:poly(A) polymerase
MEQAFIQKIIACLKNRGISLKFVGGLVRDHFLDLPKSIDNIDIDCAVDKPIEKVYDVLKQARFHINTMAMHYGTLTLYDKYSSLSVEITALRQDVETFGRRALAAYTPSWMSDAERRDFTINAIYYDTDNGFYDPLNGIKDLKNHRVVFIGDVQKRIKEDYLRILRFFRFLGYFKEPIYDAETLSIIRQSIDGLAFLSKERITNEFFKIIASPYPQNALKRMTECHIWQSLGLKTNIESNYFDFPQGFVVQDIFIFSLWDNDFLKEKLSLPKKILKNIYLFKSLKGIHEAYYYLGGAGALNFAWYQHCIRGVDFFALKDVIAALVKNHSAPKFPLNGHDLENIGIEEKAMGEILKQMKQWWIGEQFKPDKATCLKQVLIYKHNSE